MDADPSVMKEEKEIERFLVVGCAAIFQSDPLDKDSPRYTTAVRGWRRPLYILLDRPKAGGHYTVLREGQTCVIRYVRDGCACAFDSTVLDWDTRQYNAYCRLTWPHSITSVSFRRFERVKLRGKCVVHLGDANEEGVMQDLSLGGCAITTKTHIQPDTECEISFSLPDGTILERIECMVRRSQLLAPGKCALGCEFKPGQPGVTNDIAFFVMITLDRMVSSKKPRGRVLMLGTDSGLTGDLKSAIDDQICEVFSVNGLVDGLVRMRLSSPHMLIIAGDQEIPAPLIVQIVRKTRGFENLPIMVYGCKDTQGFEEMCFGATAFFDASIPIEQIATATTKLINKIEGQTG